MLSVRIGLAVVGFGVLWMFIRDHLQMKRAAKPVNEPPKERRMDFKLWPGSDAISIDSVVDGEERRVVYLDHSSLIIDFDKVWVNGHQLPRLSPFGRTPIRHNRRTRSKLVRLPNRYHLPQKRNLQ